MLCIIRISLFFKYFSQEVEDYKKRAIVGGARNAFYCPQLLNVVMKKYIAFIPFWTKILSTKRVPDVDHPRGNNGMVEGYIGNLKTLVKADSASLGKFGTIRVGRYIEKKKELVRLQIKEIYAGYSQFKYKYSRKTTKNDLAHDDLVSTSENWRGKGKPKEKKKKKSFFFSSSQP